MDLQRMREQIFLQLLQKTNPWEQTNYDIYIKDIIDRTEKILVILTGKYYDAKT